MLNSIFAVYYQVGLEHGYEKLIGIYTKEEWAIESKDEFKRSHQDLSHAYFYIEEIPVNEEIDIDLASW